MGLILATSQVLILPLDAANVHGPGYGLRMDIFWQVIYITSLMANTTIIPISLFIY